ncbi:MAG: hypothetical protein G01um101466_683 [Parcubacteria group bacterium Gr01-1014_66]|nr:MAG: hypothetical protein G01um101466_683 [Parcubacteria group bacterium Gr01-1014_66]
MDHLQKLTTIHYKLLSKHRGQLLRFGNAEVRISSRNTTVLRLAKKCQCVGVLYARWRAAMPWARNPH